jgi:D-3-phosphoglycerate dehydrogenase
VKETDMPKVLISDNLSPRAVEIFRRRGVDVDTRTGLKPAELEAIIGAYDGLAIRSATKVTPSLIAAATNLKVVGRAGIGVDNVDVPAATRRGIVVMNTPFGNSITTAEHAIAMMFALARQIPAADRSTQAGKWEKNRFMGVELFAKTLGIIGCGNIGAIVAERALALKMKVVAYDPFLTAERAVKLGVEKLELDDLLARADFITLHTPLTDATRNILDAVALAKCKRGVRIVNCARGGLVVESDLLAALGDGRVAGAALDVFLTEPAHESPLFGRDDVICTPHLGASTTEAQENVALQVAEQICDFLLDGAVVNAINMPSVTAEEARQLGPYMALGARLGTYLGQLSDDNIRAIAVEYEGHAAEINPKPVTACVLAGLLSQQLDSVNTVSAPVLARARNIAVTETRHDRQTDYPTLIRVTVESDGHRRTIAGSLFGNQKPRIVELAGVTIEAEFAPNMLYVRNQDRPGFIGRLGQVLGDAQINIAAFGNGRSKPGEDAICLVSTDQPVTDEALAMIRAIPHVLRVRALRF